MADHIIPQGEFLAYWTRLHSNDTILVQSGGTLYNTVIPHDVASVTLEEGAYVYVGFKTGKELNVLGPVYGYYQNSVNITLDLSERTPEDPIMISDWSLMPVDADLSVVISSSQAVGTYRLVGNAADFSKTITVTTSSDVLLGTVSQDSPELTHGLNRYTLDVNEADELCLTVSQNIPEGAKILRFKEGQLVDSNLSVAYDFVIPSTTFDQLVVLSGGKANGITLVDSSCMVNVLNGGVADGIKIVDGTLEVLQGGKASKVTIDGDGRIVIIRVAGGILDGVSTGYGLFTHLSVGDSGIVRNLDFMGFGLVDDDDSSFVIQAGGRLEDSILEPCYSTITKHEAVVMAGGAIYRVNIVGGWSNVICAVKVYGEAYDTELTGINAHLNLEEGSLAYNTVMRASSGFMTVAGAEAYDTDLKAGSLHVSSGGTVRNTRMTTEYNSYGEMPHAEIVVSEGGLALDTRITGGTLTVKQGGVASRTELSSTGHMNVNGGLAGEIVLTDGGVLEVEHNGVARDVHAVRDAVVKAGAGGTASAVSLGARNMLLVESKGRAEDVNVASGGYVYLQNGGILGGHMQLADGANVYAFEGGRIDFELS